MIKQVNYKGLYQGLIALSEAEKDTSIQSELAEAAKSVKKLGQKGFLGRAWAFLNGKSAWKKNNAKRSARIAVALQPLEITLRSIANARVSEEAGQQRAELVHFVAANTGLVKPKFIEGLTRKDLKGLREQRARIEGILKSILKGKAKLAKGGKKVAKAEAKLPKKMAKLKGEKKPVEAQVMEARLELKKKELTRIKEMIADEGYTEEKAYQALAWLDKAISDAKTGGKFEMPMMKESVQLGVLFDENVNYLEVSEYEKQMPDEQAFFEGVEKTSPEELANSYSLDDLKTLKEFAEQEGRNDLLPKVNDAIKLKGP